MSAHLSRLRLFQRHYALYVASTKFWLRTVRSNCEPNRHGHPMPIPTLMPMPPALPLNLMIVTEFLLPLWGAYRVSFFLSIYFSSDFIRGGHVTHNLSSLPGLAS
jgi:hypothetical protein